MIFLYLLHFFSHLMSSIVKAKPFDIDCSLSQGIENSVKWARAVQLKLGAHPEAEHPEAIEADFQMKDGMLILDIRAPLVRYAFERWAVDCKPNHTLDPRSHHLSLGNLQTLYGFKSATFAPSHST